MLREICTGRILVSITAYKKKSLQVVILYRCHHDKLSSFQNISDFGPEDNETWPLKFALWHTFWVEFSICFCLPQTAIHLQETPVSKTMVRKTKTCETVRVIGGKLSVAASLNGGCRRSKPDVLTNQPAAVFSNAKTIDKVTLQLWAIFPCCLIILITRRHQV